MYFTTDISQEIHRFIHKDVVVSTMVSWFFLGISFENMHSEMFATFER